MSYSNRKNSIIAGQKFISEILSNLKKHPQSRLTVHSIYILVIIFSASIMLWISWAKWADVIVDFGRELYVPWVLNEGKELYKDLFFILMVP